MLWHGLALASRHINPPGLSDDSATPVCHCQWSPGGPTHPNPISNHHTLQAKIVSHDTPHPGHPPGSGSTKSTGSKVSSSWRRHQTKRRRTSLRSNPKRWIGGSQTVLTGFTWVVTIAGEVLEDGTEASSIRCPLKPMKHEKSLWSTGSSCLAYSTPPQAARGAPD